MAFGPFALAWINPSDTIHSVAEVGAIFVLFHAGLETSPQELIRVGRKAYWLSLVAGIVVPFILGFDDIVGMVLLAVSVWKAPQGRRDEVSSQWE